VRHACVLLHPGERGKTSAGACAASWPENVKERRGWAGWGAVRRTEGAPDAD
jgi:hypothetical protein